MSEQIWDAYHRWFYENSVWSRMRWLGVPIYKSPSDLFSYQEILCDLRPTLVIEFGTHQGGSALYMRSVLDAARIDAEIVTVDIDDVVHPAARADTNIRFVHDSSTSPTVREILRETIARRPGRIFAIVDSDHRAEHVYQELLLLREFLKPGDYLIVEDGNINGHPVLPDWGPGPYEAIERYESEFPDDYRNDGEREQKFGFTFAPRGFLIRR